MPAADRSRWAHSRSRELDPWREHDACGVGLVAGAAGRRAAEIARLALQALARVAHRGAAATDRSGDGAGLLTQIPAPLFYREAASRALALAPGQPFAVGSFFLPREHDALGRATAIIEEVLCREGLPVLGWRDVPVDLEVLGAGARASCPTIRQAVVAAPDGGRYDDTTWERSLYLARRTIERRIADAGPGLEPFFVCSLSCRTLVYKALLTATGLGVVVAPGRRPVDGLMMLVPGAHEGAVEMGPALRGFYEFHECLVEPWDGPAALAFSDGVFVGSALDRNGLRPCRYKITRDGLVVAGSESGRSEERRVGEECRSRRSPYH